ncbi:MAG TPA: glycosyltransferase family 87 protein [Solirubrobacteraceae bacterium]|jgi:hypothetical protein
MVTGSPAQPERVRLASSSTAPGPGGGILALPRPLDWVSRLTLPRISIRGPLAGRLALVAMIVGALALVAFTSAAPSVLVFHSLEIFPGWQSGPMHSLLAGLYVNGTVLRTGFSLLTIAMLIAYAVALASARSLSLRLIVGVIVALHVILLLGPAFYLNDVFNYLGYARLGGLHGFNPYIHTFEQQRFDPVFPFSSWRNLSSPYGPIFTALTYPLAWMPLSAAYWVVKVVTAVFSLGLLGLVYKAARKLGRDPRVTLVFVALNPVYIVFALGGFHNDFLMLLPAIGAVVLVVSGRYRWAGAVLMIAVGIKMSMVLLLPFLLLGAGTTRRRLVTRERVDILIGAVLAAIPLLALDLVLFGLAHPNLEYQTTLVTNFSFPNIFGDIIGAGGGASWILHLAEGLLVATVLYLLYQLLKGRGDWISRAGWAMFALILSLAWLMPWYAIWLTPLAALGASSRLRKAALALTVYLVLCFIPSTQILLAQHGLDPMGGKVGQAIEHLQASLQS